jgi:putative component of toxin-antitoxin plasmid stabilization module
MVDIFKKNHWKVLDSKSTQDNKTKQKIAKRVNQVELCNVVLHKIVHGVKRHN